MIYDFVIIGAGMAGATTLWLTFFPTERYRKYILARADEALDIGQ